MIRRTAAAVRHSRAGTAPDDRSMEKGPHVSLDKQGADADPTGMTTSASGNGKRTLPAYDEMRTGHPRQNGVAHWTAPSTEALSWVESYCIRVKDLYLPRVGLDNGGAHMHLLG